MKKAIILVSFGTSNKDVYEKTLGKLVADIVQAFSEYDFYEVYTSKFIVKKLSDLNIKTLTLPEVFKQLAEAKYSEVFIQPTHISAGEEYDNKILKEANAWAGSFSRLLVGEPLVYSKNDCINLIEAIKKIFSLEDGEQLVLMGHGSPHRHNICYENIQEVIDDFNLPWHVGVLENDTPDFEAVAGRLEKYNATNILLAPLLLTAGNHADNDMTGTSNSWEQRLIKLGYQVRIDKRGLAEFSAIRQLYLDKLSNMLY